MEVVGMMSAMPQNVQMLVLNVLNGKVSATVSGSAISFLRDTVDPSTCRGDRRLLVGVSSFSHSGTIADEMLEEAP
jgi:hypothetical protein